jgi:hypothetical protein
MRSSSDSVLGRDKILLVVIVDHAAIRQREVGEEMVGADDPAHRQVGHRRVDMGNTRSGYVHSRQLPLAIVKSVKISYFGDEGPQLKALANRLADCGLG